MKKRILWAEGLLLTSSLAAFSQQTEKPNVLIILADDLGYADVGYHRLSSDISTPNIDRLAAEGVHFTTAYVTNAVSSPSRAGMLSGCYQQSFGYEDNPGPFRRAAGIHPGIPAGVKLLPAYLKEAGYATACVGKWHLGGEETDDSFPTNKGFDEFLGFLGGASTYFHGDNRQELIFRNEQPAKLEDAYLTDIIGDETVDFISRHKDGPFMVYMSFNAVHGPLQAPERLIDQYRHVKDKKRRILCAMQHAMDENIGKVLDYLEQEQLDEHTLIFFLSDNGGAPTDNHSYNLPLRGSKGTFYDGGIHTPFIIKWPGKIAPNTVYREMTSSLDIVPTVLAAAGLERPAYLDGVDLLPYLLGRVTGAPHQLLCWKMNKQWAVRDLSWKLVSSNPDNRTMLFHIAEDPYEKHDLASERPDKVLEMKKKFEEWDAQNLPKQWGWQPEVGEYVQHTEEGFENICKLKFQLADGATDAVQVVENPRPVGANPSAHVLGVQLEKGTNRLKAQVSRFNKKFRFAHVKVLMSSAGEVQVRISGDRFVPAAASQSYTAAGQWQELVFDLNYYKPVGQMEIVFPGIASREKVYLDDISYSDNGLTTN